MKHIFTLFFVLSLLGDLSRAADSPIPATRSAPDVWIIPSPSPGNGQCLREMVRRESEWSATRGQVRGIGYYAWLLNQHFSDVEIRDLFAKLRAWRLGFGFELAVLKAPNWGLPEPLQAKGAFDQFQQFAKRFKSLGMERVDWFAFDEPIYAARYAIPASGGKVPTVPAIELIGTVKDPDAANRIAYGVAETVSFMAKMRQAYPGARLGDIEPYPAMNGDELETAVNAIQKGCKQQGIKGLDFFRLDVDWDLFEQKHFGSWTEVKRIEDMCRARGIAFSLIFWAANQPRLAKDAATAMSWRDGVLHQGRAYRNAGGSPDELVIESWIQIPEHAVPETSPETFTASVLEFLKAFPPASWITNHPHSQPLDRIKASAK